jgi:hypothetical protein
MPAELLAGLRPMPLRGAKKLAGQLAMSTARAHSPLSTHASLLLPAARPGLLSLTHS